MSHFLAYAVILFAQAGTLGGKQFWTDHVDRAGWRIQQNAMTGHWRLLDPEDDRYAWGTRATCQRRLETIAAEKNLPQTTGKVAIVLHGLGRSRSAMKPLADFLHEKGGYTVINFSYASTRATLDEHASALKDILDAIPDAQEISFVGHSLGNLVVRRYLNDVAERDPIRRKFKRMVMLAPPNQGAEFARRLKDDPLFKALLGQSAQQLGENFDPTKLKLATPFFEFGILAGGAESGGGNPLIEGQDDLVVSVEETRLPGAIDFRQLAVKHTFIMQDEGALELTLHFLDHGCFETVATRQPIQ